MAHSKSSAASGKPAGPKASNRGSKATGKGGSNQGSKGAANLFSRLACATAHFAGQPVAFMTAFALVVAWMLSGPLFNYSDTWQLVINTSTTIVTFLMVFLIQHTQNRDTLALQLKLAELIIVAHGAENKLATAEDLDEDELEKLHEIYRKRADETLEHLTRRRKDIKRAS